MKNSLTIRWKETLGKNMLPCTNPKEETFLNVSDPWAVLNRRVKENILYAVYNGVFLIRGERKIKKVVVKTAPIIETSKPKTGFFDKAISGFKNVFKGKMFSRQKH